MRARKVTVHVDEDLLRRAQERTGEGVTATIRQGLELVAASEVYERLGVDVDAFGLALAHSRLRARVLARGRKARLADTLFAQSCLDHDVELVTRDMDSRHFARAIGLKLFTCGRRR